ncbi:MAG: hypothetical protein CVU14_04355 [Bacteroidetes bacterium HGW-Bacteroidetes-9]|nr:MAG: hypothetical protein CVU14_04355 [Bacteroidetes bacterium HGW-Bacteroidetes-9]
MNRQTDFAIAIAWPETYCKQPGSWYDSITHILGFSNNYYYKVGHAALVLVNSKTKKCHYFDFGRYHAPFQYGRVRSEQTDHGLKVNTIAQISQNGQRLENFTQILTELQLNHECHGEGALHASYCKIDFEQSYQKVLQLQKRSPIAYGPFKYKGSNCSRFVNTSIVAGKPDWIYIFKLKYFVLLTPTPLNNVNFLPKKVIIPKLLKTKAFCPIPIADIRKLKHTLEQPPKNDKIPDNAQWLSGEGSGSWFSINQDLDNFRIARYSPEGELECSGVFKQANINSFNINLPFQIDHLSHCQSVVVKQSENKILFKRLDHES